MDVEQALTLQAASSKIEEERERLRLLFVIEEIEQQIRILEARKGRFEAQLRRLDNAA